MKRAGSRVGSGSESPVSQWNGSIDSDPYPYQNVRNPATEVNMCAMLTDVSLEELYDRGGEEER